MPAGTPTVGPKIAKVARLLGTPLMPWQRAAADVIGALDTRGRFLHHTVIITVPRQSGKTALTLAVALHRALTLPGGKVWYTAQTGQSARERFLSDMADPAMRVLGPALTVKKGAGDTRLTVPMLASQVRPHPPNDEYLHGEQSDLNLIDEAWSYSETQARALVQAITPTQNTRPNAQTIILSTMGTAESTWFHNRVDEARRGIPGVAIVDWGIGDAVDPTDIAAVAAAHPAVGHTIEIDALETASSAMSPGEFARAYGNRATTTRDAVIERTILAQAVTDTPLDESAPVAIAAAVSWQRDQTAILAAGTIDGTPAVEVIDCRPGTSWAPPVLEQIAEAHRPVALVVDNHGPSAALHDALTQAGVDVIAPSGREVSTATDDMIDRLTDDPQRMLLRRDDALLEEWAAVAMRTVSDLGHVISRRHSAGSIARVEASVLAVWGLTHAPAVAPVPSLYIG